MTQIKDLTADQWVNITTAISIHIKTPTKETHTFNVHAKEHAAIYGPHAVAKTEDGNIQELHFVIDLKDVTLIDIAHNNDKMYTNSRNRQNLRKHIRNDFNKLFIKIQNDALTQYTIQNDKNWHDITPIFELDSVSMHHSKLKIILKRGL